jgi:hypothetical protein
MSGCLKLSGVRVWGRLSGLWIVSDGFWFCEGSS